PPPPDRLARLPRPPPAPLQNRAGVPLLPAPDHPPRPPERLVAARIGPPPEGRHHQPLRPPSQRLQVTKDRQHRQHHAEQEREQELGYDSPQQVRPPFAKRRPSRLAERRRQHGGGRQQQVKQAEQRRC